MSDRQDEAPNKRPIKIAIPPSKIFRSQGSPIRQVSADSAATPAEHQRTSGLPEFTQNQPPTTPNFFAVPSASRPPRGQLSPRRPDVPFTPTRELHSAAEQKEDNAGARLAKAEAEKAAIEKYYYEKGLKTQEERDEFERRLQEREKDYRTLRHDCDNAQSEAKALKDLLEHEKSKYEGSIQTYEAMKAVKEQDEGRTHSLETQLKTLMSSMEDLQNAHEKHETENEEKAAMIVALHTELDKKESEIDELRSMVQENAQAKQELENLNEDFEDIWSDLGKGLNPTQYLKRAREERQELLRRTDSQTSLANQAAAMPGSRPGARTDNRQISSRSIQDELDGLDESDDEAGDIDAFKRGAMNTLLDVMGGDAPKEEQEDEQTITKSSNWLLEPPPSEPVEPWEPDVFSNAIDKSLRYHGPARDKSPGRERNMRHKETQTPNITDDDHSIMTQSAAMAAQAAPVAPAVPPQMEANTEILEMKLELKKVKNALADRTTSLQQREKSIKSNHSMIQSLEEKITKQAEALRQAQAIPTVQPAIAAPAVASKTFSFSGISALETKPEHVANPIFKRHVKPVAEPVTKPAVQPVPRPVVAAPAPVTVFRTAPVEVWPWWLKYIISAAFIAYVCLWWSTAAERSLWLSANDQTHQRLLALTTGTAQVWYEPYILQFEEWMGISKALMG